MELLSTIANRNLTFLLRISAVPDFELAISYALSTAGCSNSTGDGFRPKLVKAAAEVVSLIFAYAAKAGTKETGLFSKPIQFVTDPSTFLQNYKKLIRNSGMHHKSHFRGSN